MSKVVYLSGSPWSATVVLIRKEKRLPELVCYLQSRNEVDVEDKYLVPRIDVWMNQSFEFCV